MAKSVDVVALLQESRAMHRKTRTFMFDVMACLEKMQHTVEEKADDIHGVRRGSMVSNGHAVHQHRLSTASARNAGGGGGHHRPAATSLRPSQSATTLRPPDPAQDLNRPHSARNYS